MEKRVISTQIQEEDIKTETSLRPLSLDEYIGQEKIKNNLRVYIEAAKMRGEPLDHVLFYGPPGLGKTTLASIIANEMGVHMKVTSGPAIAKPGEMAAILSNLQEGDVLFIDEIHRLNRQVEEVLYPAMEDFAIDIMVGKGATARSIRLDLPKFTMVGATTRAGLLSAPLRDRFGVVHHLEYYTPEELETIIIHSAAKLQVEIDSEGAHEMASRSRGTPRLANRLLRRVRDFAQLRYNGVITQEVAAFALDLLEVDKLGLDKSDRKGIEFGYDLYQCALEPNFSLMEILKSHTEMEAPEKNEETALPVVEAVEPVTGTQTLSSGKKSVQEEILEKTGSWKNFFHKKKKQPVETYVAEADQIKSGSVLFLREQGNTGETTFLREEKHYGLLLKSKNPDYPDLKMEGASFLIGKRKESVDGWVPAPTVSRIHARIIKEEGCYLLEDLNSTNGTRAGQHQLNPYELFPLDNGMQVAFAGAEYEAYL